MVNPRAPEPVSEYVRHLIEKWEADGKLLKDLAKRAGLGTSMPSQIKAKTSDVTNYSGPKLAAAWGWSYPELVSRAYAWWARRESGASEDEAPHSARVEAMDRAKGLGATEGAIQRVLASHDGPEFDELDEMAWVAMFLNEALQERTLRARGKARERETRRRTQAYHRDAQALHEKRRAQRAERDAEAARDRAPRPQTRRPTGTDGKK